MTGLLLLSATRCDAQIFHKKKKVNKSTSAENTAEPDKILYDKAMEDVKHGRHEVGRLNLQTLINTYPDSEYLADAKLAIADSFYKEGGTANLTQAIQAYKDFGIFFPMIEEAAYAQLQVAMTHYKQLEKPDRDRTHARAAEDEFQTFLSKYPSDKLALTAEQNAPRQRESIIKKPLRLVKTGPDQELRAAAQGGKPTMTPEAESEVGIDVLKGGNQTRITGPGSGLVGDITPGGSGATTGGAAENVAPTTEGTEEKPVAPPDPNAPPAAESSANGASSTGTAETAPKTDATPAATGQPADAAKTDGATAQSGAHR